MKKSLSLVCVALATGVSLAEVKNLPQPNLDPNCESNYRNYNYNCLVNAKAATGFSGGYSALTNGEFWDDGKDPSSDKDYRLWGSSNSSITGAMGAKASEAGTVFEGNSLLVGNASDWSSSWLSLSGPGSGKTGTLWFKNDGLKFGKNGGIFQVEGAASGTSVITGKVSLVNTTFQDPAWAIIRYNNNAPMHFAFESFTGTSTDAISFKYMDSAALSNSPFIFSGNMTDFYGTMRFIHNSVCSFRDVTIPGTVRFDHKVTVDTAQTAVEFGQLVTSNRYVSATDIRKTTINLAVSTTTNSSLKVKDAVTIMGPEGQVAKPDVKVTFSGAILPTTLKTAFSETPRTMTLLDVPAASGTFADLFALNKGTYPSSTYDDVAKRGAWNILMKTCFYGEETVGDRRQLNLRIPRFTYSPNAAPSNKPIFTDLSNFHGLTAEDEIQPDTAYVLTSDTDVYLFPNQAEYTFPGAAVVICEGCYPKISGVTEVSNLVVLGWNNLGAGWGQSRYSLRGNVTFLKMDSTGYPGGTCNINGRVDANVPFEFEANLHGDGTISLNSPNWEKANRWVTFTGDNSDFSGTLTIVGTTNGDKPVYTTLSITNGLALGGALPAFNASAVKLANNGILKVGDNAALTEPTRGFYVTGRGEVSVADGKQLTIGSQLTFDGELLKTGAGTLALGGPLRFGSDLSEEPVSDRNILTMTAGSIRSLSKGATDGLKILLSPNAAIGVASPLETISDDERDYGVYNASDYGCFVSEDGNLNVRLDETDRYDEDGNDLWPSSFSRAICTVSNGVASELEGTFRLAGKPRGIKMTVVPVQNEDGVTTTFRADFVRCGLSIIVR